MNFLQHLQLIDLWDVDFEVHFGNTKIGNKEKVEKRCKVYEASKIYGIFVEIKIIDPNNNPNKEHIIIAINKKKRGKTFFGPNSRKKAKKCMKFSFKSSVQ